MGRLLDSINNPNDIKKIDPSDYRELAHEIRTFLVHNISRTGGHLASNLGVVELTMALHLVCDLPKDRIVFDVGHQCYTHKILTGRKNEFRSLRSYGGLSGFPKRNESPCDAFDTGHSSTSISAALGMVKARELNGTDEKIFAVIGDGALSGGMAYEALNNAARIKSNLVIVINDNQMSISKNVGGMASYLGKIRTDRKYTQLKDRVEDALGHVPGGDLFADRIRDVKDMLKRAMIPGMLFEDMGITYIGPIDGHNVNQMTGAFRNALKMDSAVIVHVCTKKGRGYKPAEKNPARFHGIASFNEKDGSSRSRSNEETYSAAFGRKLVSLAETDEKIYAITAAMPDGTGLVPMFRKFPDRASDVGIAEEHAVTYAAGMAVRGIKPVVAVYSTFLQRAYDQIISDVCLQNLHVVFAVDRAGIVGRDGETHQGIFDIAYLMQMPGMTIMAPKDVWELEQMMELAFRMNGPVAIRYPRGKADPEAVYEEPLVPGRSEVIKEGKKAAVIAVGTMTQTVLRAADILETQYGTDVAVINARFLKPLDTQLLDRLSEEYKMIVTVEEGILTGGFGQQVASYFSENRKIRVHCIGLPDEFIEHGDCETLKDIYGLTPEKIASALERFIKKR